MAAPAGTACTNHPKRDRVASCGNCGKPLCRDCVVHTPVGIKCPACTGERVPAAASAGRPAPSRPAAPRPSRGSRPRWLVPAAVAAAVLLVGVVVLTRSGGGPPKERAVREEDPANPSSSDTPDEFKFQLAGGGGTKIGASL